MPEPINDATITPEQAQALENGTEEAPVVTPEEPKPAEVVVPEDPKPAEEPEVLLTQKRSIYKDLKEKKVEVREKNELIEQKDKEIADLQEQLKKAKTPAEVEEADNDLIEYAEAVDADPETIKKLIPILEKRIKAQGSNISQEDIDFLKEAKAKATENVAKEAFINEWDTFIPSLKTEFPYISDADLIAVRKEVDRLAHTPEFHDKEIDYIYFKQKNSLSKLISPKKESIEGGGPVIPTNAAPTVVEFSGKMSPADMQKAIDAEPRGSNLEVRSSK